MSLQSRHGSSRYLGLAAFAVALLLVIVGAAASWLNVRRLRDSFDWVTHTRQVLIQVGTIESDLASAIATQRGLSADRRSRATGRIPPVQRRSPHPDADALRQLVTDKCGRRRRLDLLLPLIGKRLEFAGMGINQAACRPPGSPPPCRARRRCGRAPRSATACGVSATRKPICSPSGRRAPTGTRRSPLGFPRRPLFWRWERRRWGGFSYGANASSCCSSASVSRMLELRGKLLHVGRLHTVGQTASMLTHKVNQPLTAARELFGAAQRITAAEAVGLRRASGDAMQR